MNFLAPLFLFGALAVALPVLFHLIRQTTRQRLPFSSLMFLSATPPRLTRRSRVEHWLLLLLRALVLILLALGFSRPFFPGTSSAADATGAPVQRLILVDQSASMRQTGLWQRTTEQLESILQEAAPHDEMAIMRFARTLDPVVTFEQWNVWPVPERAQQALTLFRSVQPTWDRTELGDALISAATLLMDRPGSQADALPSQRELVVLSDLQNGSRYESLASFDWPGNVAVILHPIAPTTESNAGVSVLMDGSDALIPTGNSDSEIRVRVQNAGHSRKERFQVGWAAPVTPGTTPDRFLGTAQDVYVPPGQSRVIALEPPDTNTPGESDGGLAVLLRGDSEPFDNVAWVVPPRPVTTRLVYYGSDSPDVTRTPSFFLKRALPATTRQVLELEVLSPQTASVDPGSSRLAVMTEPLAPDLARDWHRRLRNGGRALLVLSRADTALAETLSVLSGTPPLELQEVSPRRYALLGELDFQHPLLAPFADPRYSDFTRIHFWKYRRLDLSDMPDARVLARFDSRHPALVEFPVENGRLLVLTTGWNPEDSQLALSTKFVPLLHSILEWSGAWIRTLPAWSIGDAVPLDGWGFADGAELEWIRPDGSREALPPETSRLPPVDEPGIYGIRPRDPAGNPADITRFAVNLDPMESRTGPMPPDVLEGFGLPVAGARVAAARQEARVAALNRAERSETENRQKAWRWLLTLAMVCLLAESWLAGWTTRMSPSHNAQPVPAS